MQTFVPEASVVMSVRSLDPRRLGKQRVETLQIMRALAGLSKGWVNHPAVKMWRGYESGLMYYQEETCKHWTEHWGYKDTCLNKTFSVFDEHFDAARDELPHWWGVLMVHDSHKRALIYKSPEYYSEQWPDFEGEYNYYWPEGKNV
jgi:hypothetical protein